MRGRERRETDKWPEEGKKGKGDRQVKAKKAESAMDWGIRRMGWARINLVIAVLRFVFDCILQLIKPVSFSISRFQLNSAYCR